MILTIALWVWISHHTIKPMKHHPKITITSVQMATAAAPIMFHARSLDICFGLRTDKDSPKIIKCK